MAIKLRRSLTTGTPPVAKPLSLNPISAAISSRQPVNAAEIVRDSTSLNPDKSLVMDRKKATKYGFLHFFTGAFLSNPVPKGLRGPFLGWLSILSQELFTWQTAKNIVTPELRKSGKVVTDMVSSQIRTSKDNPTPVWNTLQHLTRVRPYKKELSTGTSKGSVPGFLVEFPIITLSMSEVSLLLANALGETFTQIKSIPDIMVPKVEDTLISTLSFSNVLFPKATQSALDKTEAMLFEYPQTGLTSSRRVFGIRMFLDKPTVEHFTCTKYEDINPLDVYGPLQNWVGSYFQNKKAFYSRSIQSIAKSLPENPRSSVRVDKRTNVCITPDARFYFIPRKNGKPIDNTETYVKQRSDRWNQEDGWFGKYNPKLSETDKSDGAVVPKDSFNPIIVLSDEVNSKFSYTEESGKLATIDLSDAVPADSTRTFYFLEIPLSSPRAEVFLSKASDFLKSYALLNPIAGEASEELDSQNRARSSLISLASQSFQRDVVALAANRLGYDTPEAVKLHHLYELSDAEKVAQMEKADTNLPGPLAAWEQSVVSNLNLFVSLCKEVTDKLLTDPESVYKSRSPLTMVTVGAQIILFSTYVPEYESIYNEERNKIALRFRSSKAVKPLDWKPDAVPFIGKNQGFLPHQSRLFFQKQQAGDPKEVFFDIAAGGGKTFVNVYDILDQMARGNKGPYIVIGLSTLTSTYIKEFMAVTNGQVNLIPVTQESIRHHGFERLENYIKAAPVNSVIITSYKALIFKSQELFYGSEPIRIYPVVELLKKFAPTYIFMDEVHRVKGSDSQEAAAVACLVADIPYKRLATGTFVSNTLLDLVGLTRFVNPMIFGDEDDFKEEFAEEVGKGGKVLRWKEKAESKIKSTLMNRLTYLESKRKEWQAILPTVKYEYHQVNMTRQQQLVYDVMIKEEVEALQAKARLDENTRKLLDSLESDDPLEGGADQRMIFSQLSRIERYFIAPKLDPMGASFTGNDAISEKVIKAIDLCKKHIESGYPGKVLIFTNHVRSVEEVYRHMPADLQAQTIVYSSADKDEHLAQFEKDDTKKILVGVQQSLNTGLNLQYASRLIFLETVLTPGSLEQAISRIRRPNVKDAEPRKYIYVDWIIANLSIDVTKISYLISKVISREKFDAAGGNYPSVENIETPPLFRLNLQSLQSRNDFSANMASYLEAQKAMTDAIRAEDELYLNQNRGNLLDQNGRLRISGIDRSANIENAGIMSDTIYVAGMNLPSSVMKSEKDGGLGLIRYDDFLVKRINEELEKDPDFLLKNVRTPEDLEALKSYLRVHEDSEGSFIVEDSDDEDEDDDEDTEEEGPKKKKSKEEDTLSILREARLVAEAALMQGVVIHTDMGEGTFFSPARKWITVRLASGEKIKVRRGSAFVVSGGKINKKLRSTLRDQAVKLFADDLEILPSMNGLSKIELPPEEEQAPTKKKGIQIQPTTPKVKKVTPVPVEKVKDLPKKAPKEVDEDAFESVDEEETPPPTRNKPSAPVAPTPPGRKKVTPIQEDEEDPFAGVDEEEAPPSRKKTTPAPAPTPPGRKKATPPEEEDDYSDPFAEDEEKEAPPTRRKTTRVPEEDEETPPTKKSKIQIKPSTPVTKPEDITLDDEAEDDTTDEEEDISEDDQGDLGINLRVFSLSNYVGIEFSDIDMSTLKESPFSNPKSALSAVVSALEEVGFRREPHHYEILPKGYLILDKILENLPKKDLELDDDSEVILSGMLEMAKKNAKKTGKEAFVLNHKSLHAQGLRNFYAREFKRNPGKGVIQLYPIVRLTHSSKDPEKMISSMRVGVPINNQPAAAKTFFSMVKTIPEGLAVLFEHRDDLPVTTSLSREEAMKPGRAAVYTGPSRLSLYGNTTSDLRNKLKKIYQSLLSEKIEILNFGEVDKQLTHPVLVNLDQYHKMRLEEDSQDTEEPTSNNPPEDEEDLFNW